MVQANSQEYTHQRSTWDLIRSFLALLGTHRRTLVWALLALTVARLFALLPPIAIKFVVDYVIGGNQLPAALSQLQSVAPWLLLVSVIGMVLAAELLKLVLQISSRWQATRASRLVELSVRRRVLRHIMRLPLYRVQEIKSGGAASILRRDVNDVGRLTMVMLYDPWRAAIQFAGSLCVLAWVDWRLLVTGVLALPLVYVTHRTWIKRIRPLSRQARRQRQEVDALATESIGGMRLIRAYGRERAEAKRIMQGNHLMVRQQLHVWWWSRIVEIVWGTLTPISGCLLLLYCGRAILDGSMTYGDLMMLLALLLMLLNPLQILAQNGSDLQNSLAGLDRVLGLLNEPSELSSQQGTVIVPQTECRGQVTFDNVSFRYPGATHDALADFSLEVAPGETVALVGPSGAGKTTACNLVARFYDPIKGRLLLDGYDLRELNLRAYRQLIAVVEQDVILFDGTLAENIACGRRHSSPADIRSAAIMANVDHFAQQLPDGYDTIIGERGAKLSGGQRQRVAIARAILADPQILILDEATSNLDTENEQLIQRALATLTTNRTCLVIAHRLSTIENADRIVVVDAGQVVETGTHESLMATEGRYHEMVLLQTNPPVHDTA
ncbi:MAG: ABC transporter ATP-binding protein [Blastopirellula sp.]|nr:ABC transporter ATP-binding protein [Blastopirellula sp.]